MLPLANPLEFLKEAKEDSKAALTVAILLFIPFVLYWLYVKCGTVIAQGMSDNSTEKDTVSLDQTVSQAQKTLNSVSKIVDKERTKK